MIYLVLITVTLISSAACEKLCLYCDHVPIPQDCSRVVRCGAHEVSTDLDLLLYMSLGNILK